MLRRWHTAINVALEIVAYAVAGMIAGITISLAINYLAFLIGVGR